MASCTPRLLSGLAAALLLGSLPMAAQAQAKAPPRQPGEFLCCTDSGGSRVCGDILPPQCNGRAYKVYNQQGMLVREVAAPLSAEEKATKAEEQRLQKELDAAEKEQRRKDQALLETYTSLQDIDRMQARAEAEVKTAITNAEAKVAEAQKRRKKFENEAEFYTNKTLPPDIAKGLRDEDVEIKSLNELIEAKKREMDLIKTKYAEDRRRYIQLSRRPAGSGGSSATERPR